MFSKFKKVQHVALCCLAALWLAGCSSSAPSISNNYYYTDSWWHDDFWFYQDHVYPDCCHTDGEFKQVVENWWHTLDPEKQDQIKDKIDGWKEGDGPDISALKNDFNQKFESLPEDKQQAIMEKREAVRQKVSDTQLTTEQKQTMQTKWQSKQRPTLDRAPNKPVTRPTTRPTTRPAIRPNIRSGNFGGRTGGGRLGGARR
ncbi:hypothetical protein [Vibrio litoralis]|uniref:hypothetical protein n=1 Tax=Vibrio litoralis TaxID=335972 RepID=UPI00186897BF|nr:hypothetical protein [Vibrio litoralis]